MNVDGIVEPGFERVRDAFVRNFDEHGDVGAGFCLHVEGRKVVDVWGGVADEATNEPYGESTLQLVFSTTKGATAACANLLMQRGLLDIDAPVVTYWPEFGAAGKENIPVRWLLCHKAGLPVIDKRLSLAEVLAWDPVIAALSVQEPVWEPGTAHGYHALTFGWLVGEVVRRIDGRSLGTFFADEIAKPLGLEFWIGLPESEEHRVAPLIGNLLPEGDVPNEELRALIEEFTGPDSVLGRALTLNGAFDMDCWNDRAVHAAEIGAANGITDARSLSRLVCRSCRCASRRAGCAAVLAGADRRRPRTSDRGQRPLLVLRHELRSGFLHRFAVRPVWRRGVVRSFRSRGFDGLRRSRQPDRRGIRDEPDGTEPFGRSANPRTGPGEL